MNNVEMFQAFRNKGNLVPFNFMKFKPYPVAPQVDDFSRSARHFDRQSFQGIQH